jgi:hypothetical protein
MQLFDVQDISARCRRCKTTTRLNLLKPFDDDACPICGAKGWEVLSVLIAAMRRVRGSGLFESFEFNPPAVGE